MNDLNEVEFEMLLQGEVHALFPRGLIEPPICLFAGAFDPLHQGHLEMAKLAEEFTQLRCVFELCIANIDKSPIGLAEVSQRVRHFRKSQPLILSKAATFVEKARIFPSSTFIVGADTISRIAESKYYGSESNRVAAFEEIARLNCQFLVFGRENNGQFQTMDELALPDELVSLCQQVPKSKFAMNVSSTKIRTRNQKDAQT